VVDFSAQLVALVIPPVEARVRPQLGFYDKQIGPHLDHQVRLCSIGELRPELEPGLSSVGIGDVQAAAPQPRTEEPLPVAVIGEREDLSGQDILVIEEAGRELATELNGVHGAHDRSAF
jgi:hypothetical protein